MRLVLGVLALGLAACAEGSLALQGDLLGRASEDLQCPRDEIKVQGVGDDQQKLLRAVGGPNSAYAHGCGKRLAYAHMCVADGSSCDWYSVKKLRIEQLLKRVSFPNPRSWIGSPSRDGDEGGG